MDEQVKNVLALLTLEEKASLCSGLGLWQTKPIKDKGIPEIWMADGSNGIRIMKPVKNERKQETSEFLKVTDLTQDSPTIDTQYPAVCYPSGAALASTWDPELIEEMAESLGDECRYFKVDLLLAPAINIKRSPLGGRGYEYYSEDPYLTGRIAEGFIRGVQKTGIGTSVKHFACNNAETLRINMSSDLDERALREIYLAPFEMCVKNAKPWTVMSSYNKVNGVQMAENQRLLTDILRKEWGFDGVVVSDWGGIKDRVAALRAGNDLDMPENRRNDREIVEAVQRGELSEEILDRSVARILSLILRAKEHRRPLDTVDFEAHRQIAEKVAEDSIVLLKNQGDILPITKEKYRKVAILGQFAKKPRYQGGGCTLVDPIRISSPYEEIQKLAGEDIQILYADGYQASSNTITEEMLQEAVDAARGADMAVIFAGLWVAYDREGFDRKSLAIDSSHIQLIQEVCKVQDKVAVVLSNGDAVTMDPWIQNVGAVVEQFLTGETVGEAVAKILFGKVSPSGKLPVTFPKRLEDTSAYPHFPGECGHNLYGESVLVGYRYFDTKKIQPLFPFGYGKSYTTFTYSDLHCSTRQMRDTDTLTVTLDVTNTGPVRGKEIVQLYVSEERSRLLRPEKELRGFKKIELDPGETKTISFDLSYRDLAYYDPEASDWVVDKGTFYIHAAADSRDIRQTASIEVVETTPKFRKLYLDSQHIAVFENETAKQMYLEFLVEHHIIAAQDIERMVPLLRGNYMGIYNVLTSLLGADIQKAQLQELLDRINAALDPHNTSLS